MHVFHIVSDVGGDDSGDDEFDVAPRDGSTCMSVVVALIMMAGVGVLVTLVYIQSGAVSYGEASIPVTNKTIHI